MNSQKLFSQGRRHERGIAMVTVLMFLVIMTIIGMAAMRSSGLQERMSGNMRDQDVAFQAAENALREGEAWVNALVAMPTVSASGSGNCTAPCANTVWTLDAVEINAGNFTDHANIWDAGVKNVRAGTIVGTENTAPQYVIEYNRFISDPTSSLNIGQPGDENGRQLFRVTARGTGMTDDSRSVTQSTYAKRMN